MLIKDLFSYFAKFVPVASLERSFLSSTGTPYDNLRTAVIAEPHTLRQAAIQDYIFGINADSVQQRISSVRGIYLFIDYGNIRSDINGVDVKTDRMTVAITVAQPTPDSMDQPALAIVQDDCLKILSDIRRQMRQDYDSGVEWLPHGSSEIQPFTAKALANSYGWTLSVTVEGIDIV